ncbi:hypothetical protein LINPERHAP2_LOCUS18294 [Linum perenne]
MLITARRTQNREKEALAVSGTGGIGETASVQVTIRPRRRRTSTSSSTTRRSTSSSALDETAPSKLKRRRRREIPAAIVSGPMMGGHRTARSRSP